MLEIAGIIAAFSLLIILVNRRYPLALAMFSASAALLVTSGQPLLPMLREAALAAISRDSLELASVVLLIGALSKVMNQYGLLDEMSDSIAHLLKSVKPAIMIIPALVGALPVLGGAIMSAPMIDKLGDHIDLSPAKKSAGNNVFRHTLFFIFPFSPSLILAAKLADMSVTELISRLYPFAIGLWAVGYLSFLRSAREDMSGYDPAFRVGSLKRFLASSSPVLLSLGLALVLEVPLYLALVAGMGLAVFLVRSKADFSMRVMLRGLDYNMGLAMMGIMVFRTMVQHIGLIGKLVDWVRNAGVPLGVIFFVLPFIIGLVSASHTTTLGITLPLLLPLVPLGQSKVAYVMLMHVSSFLAYFASPLHMCAVLTNEYFHVRISESARECLPVIAAMGALAIGLFFVYR